MSGQVWIVVAGLAIVVVVVGVGGLVQRLLAPGAATRRSEDGAQPDPQMPFGR